MKKIKLVIGIMTSSTLAAKFAPVAVFHGVGDNCDDDFMADFTVGLSDKL